MIVITEKSNISNKNRFKTRLKLHRMRYLCTYETNYAFCVSKNDHRDMLILVRCDVFAKDIFGDIFSVSQH